MLLSVLLHPPDCTVADHDITQRWDGTYDFPAWFVPPIPDRNSMMTNKTGLQTILYTLFVVCTSKLSCFCMDYFTTILSFLHTVICFFSLYEYFLHENFYIRSKYSNRAVIHINHTKIFLHENFCTNIKQIMVC